MIDLDNIDDLDDERTYGQVSTAAGARPARAATGLRGWHRGQDSSGMPAPLDTPHHVS